MATATPVQFARAERAIDITAALVERLFQEEWLRRQDFHLMLSLRVNLSFEILAERSFGNIGDCASIYRPIATGKTEITARTGLPSREVQLMCPDLLVPGDVIYWGSWIEGDIIGGGSGVQAFADEFVSKTAVGAYHLLGEQDIDERRQAANDGGSFRL